MRAEAVQGLIDREPARSGRGEADSWLDRNTWARCISRTLPIAMIPNIYNANYQILQTPTHVVIVMEMIHEARIVPLSGQPHAADDIRQWLGDARGYWDGDTLVVETTHFNAKLDGGDYQPSHVTPTGPRGSGETLPVVARLTLPHPPTTGHPPHPRGQGRLGPRPRSGARRARQHHHEIVSATTTGRGDI